MVCKKASDWTAAAGGEPRSCFGLAEAPGGLQADNMIFSKLLDCRHRLVGSEEFVFSFSLSLPSTVQIVFHIICLSNPVVFLRSRVAAQHSSAV